MIINNIVAEKRKALTKTDIVNYNGTACMVIYTKNTYGLLGLEGEYAGVVVMEYDKYSELQSANLQLLACGDKVVISKDDTIGRCTEHGCRLL